MTDPLLATPHPWVIGVWVLLSFCGFAGIVAVASPRWFARLSRGGSKWIDTNRVAAVLDRRIEVDQYLLPYSRWLGAAVLASVAALVYVMGHHMRLLW
jgi:hypothetical protein